MSELVLKPDPANIAADAFDHWAWKYYDAAQLVIADEAVGFNPVPFTLLGHAIELALKARHLRHGKSVAEVRSFGHKLRTVFDSLPDGAESVLTEEESGILTEISEIHSGNRRGFYLTEADVGTRFTDFPNLNALNQLAAKLLPQAAAQTAS